MMMNKGLFSGNVTRDPEAKNVSATFNVVKFGLAVNDRKNRKKDKNSGEYVDSPVFVDCEIHNSEKGELLMKYAKKGSALEVDGFWRLDQWTAPDGQRRSKLFLIVEDWNFGFQPKRDKEAAPSKVDNGGGDEAPVAVEDEIPF
jgi:single-strand DNA-binding protein